MIVNKLLTRKGWRVVAHSMLVATGTGLLYLLANMILEGVHQGHSINWWVFLGLGIIFSLWTVVLGSILAKAELTEWR
jgi:hypothetical protein